jgi:hypothetical protein
MASCFCECSVTLNRQLVTAWIALEAGQFSGFRSISVGWTGRVAVVCNQSEAPRGESAEQLWRAVVFGVPVHSWLQKKHQSLVTADPGSEPDEQNRKITKY